MPWLIRPRRSLLPDATGRAASAFRANPEEVLEGDTTERSLPRLRRLK
jgi:hypothetical protein